MEKNVNPLVKGNLQFCGQLPELTIENVKLKIVVFPSEMN